MSGASADDQPEAVDDLGAVLRSRLRNVALPGAPRNTRKLTILLLTGEILANGCRCGWQTNRF
jgi:hypothetical protein